MRSPWLMVTLVWMTAGCGPVVEGATSVEALRGLDAEEAAFVQLLNTYRAANGRPPVVATRLLNQVAYDHSLDMGTRRYFSHNSPEGTTPFQRMRAAGYSGGRAENIAAGNADAQRTFTQWRNSPGHNTNMLDPSSRAIGIGRAYVAGSPYRYYWTNVFGTVVDSTAITGTTPADAGVADAGARDAGLRDAGLRDAGFRDAGFRDAGFRDAGFRDAGGGDVGIATRDVPGGDVVPGPTDAGQGGSVAPVDASEDAGAPMREEWASQSGGCRTAPTRGTRGACEAAWGLVAVAVGAARRRRRSR